jgi:hypothetical protein
VVVHLDAQPLKNDRPSQARSTSWWPEADLFAVQGCCGREATFGCYKPGATWERRFRFGNRRGSMINSVERDGRCRPGLPLPLLFAPVILVTALLVVWPGWLRTAQAQSWVSEEGGGVRHIVVTINKSRTLRFDKPFASAVVGAPDIVDALPMSDRVLYIQGKKVGTTNVSVFDQSMKLIGVLDVEVAIDTGNLQEKIRSITGSRGIRVRSSNGQIVLSGVAGNAVAAERAVAVASGQDRRR